MPRSVPLNGFFLYLRDQAASAARSGRGPAPDQGVGVPFGALFIGGVPVTINGGYIVIGASA